MPFRPAACILLVMLLVLSPAWGKKGVGVSGPDQVFTVPQGTNMTSYVRIYNTGDELTSYVISMDGSVSDLTQLEAWEVTIQPEQNAKLIITYDVPSDLALGVYTGTLTASIQGAQIAPGVSKEVSLAVIQHRPNELPTVSFLSPLQPTVKGLVNVTIKAEDPDGQVVEISIAVDERVVSTTNGYLWDTTTVANGLHTLTARASDGQDEGTAEVRVRVMNPGRLPVWFWVALPLVLFTLVLVIAVSSGARGRTGGEK